MKNGPTNYVAPPEPPPVLIDEDNDICSKKKKLQLQQPPSQPESALCSLPVEDIFRNEVLDSSDNSAFFVVDLNGLHRLFQQWTKLLPMVHPFYAMKCNPDACVMATMNSLGANFDCASREEIASVLKMGVAPTRIIFANPCKQVSHIRFAYENGVDHMTFDNADELHKVKANHPNAKMVLRILADDSKSMCKFGVKFGASLSVTMDLLELAKSLGVDVVGVSFHVGSGCFDPAVYADAVHRARMVFDQAESLGMKFYLLDLGGGFPGVDGVDGCPFADIAAELRPVLTKLFPSDDVRIIAEPGRYFAASVFHLAVNIHARRTVHTAADEKPSFMYYVNDGVYGSFNCLMFDHQSITPRVLCRNGEFVYGRPIEDAEEYNCSIWGPTCDSMDCLTRSMMLPELHVGDWLFFERMGAYTGSAASTFNGMPKPKMFYTNVEVDTDDDD